MRKYIFEDEFSYLEWCEATVRAIYYARIAMDNDAIKQEIDQIADTLHVPEGTPFYNPEVVV